MIKENNTTNRSGAPIAIINRLNACCTTHCIFSWISSTQWTLGSWSLRICLLTKSSNEISGTYKAGRGPYNTKKQKCINYRAHLRHGHTQMCFISTERDEILRSSNTGISWLGCFNFFCVLYLKLRKFSWLAR